MKKALLIISILACTAGIAQNKDANLWTGFGTDLGITKDFSIEFESQVRFDQNVGRMRQVYGELGANYQIVDGLEAGLIYRYSRKNNSDFYFNENRFCLDASYAYRMEFGLLLKTRMRFQHAFDRFKEVNGVYPRRKNVYRWSFKFGYKNKEFKLIQPYVGFELFHALNPKNETGDFLDTYRLKGGFLLDLPKRHSVKVFYIYEHENRTNDNLAHIYGVQYNSSFKSLHKRKKKKD